MFTKNKIKEIFSKTKGHCHFCGDPLILEKYGWKNLDDLDGAWETDHIIQKGKGGRKEAENCLPACLRCNRLRWHRKGNDLRDLILLGLIAKDEIKKGSYIGKEVLKLMDKRIEVNKKRRCNIS